MFLWSVWRDRERTVVGFGESGTAVVIPDRESAGDHPAVRVHARIGEVLRIDIELWISVHVKDALV